MTNARGTSWSLDEVEATVAGYLRMLSFELAGQPYKKVDHVRQLQGLLKNRTSRAVELKFQNVSAILMEQGMPYIPGYKPMGHYQQLLSRVLLESVSNDSGFDDLVLHAVERVAVVPEIEDIKGIRVEPPRRSRVEDSPREPEPYVRRAFKRDYLQLESRNRSLGASGERFIAEFETRRLHTAGHRNLADRVEQVSTTRGDGLGYDVLSFETSGRERFIEVKTTDFGAVTPFYVSRNEVAFSKEFASQFVLARVHEFRASPKFFELKGSIRDSVRLDAVTYLARI